MAEPTYVTIIADDLQLGGICHHLKGREITLEDFLKRFSQALFGHIKSEIHPYIYQVDIDFLANHGIIVSNNEYITLASDYLRRTSRTILNLKLSISELSRGIEDIRAKQSTSDESEEEEGEEEEEEEEVEVEVEEAEEAEAEEEEAEAAKAEKIVTVVAPKKVHVKTKVFKKLERIAGRCATTATVGRKRGPMSEEKKAIANEKKRLNKAAKIAKVSSPHIPIPISLTLDEEEIDIISTPKFVFDQ